ncbi:MULTISPECIES: Na+/H+ antiporter NhaC [Anaerococcus]|uniref:Na+/H+ antiporter NhaC n=3 Tax=Peptoniphilaceae TaxID=1570339 RepID=UPI001AEA2ABD|nr:MULTISPECIES: Na+/H+ antiporter NhaC [Anaerococcus]MBP2068937.1 NhaC family Na+:H+ antiporter [Anaerococcus nagyae]MDU1864972.1 Na+/H+ antiporter NhaC [Anaerococcus sp.]MDU2566074.1 Na+/H+ antiporter NhaC [Anaerococcus sp.]MDU3212111.1 Na+/H+ antiporter NhaC [Anaerococcus sp.]
MIDTKEKTKPSTLQAISPLVIMIVLLTIGVGFLKLRAEPIILICTIITSMIAKTLGYTWEELQRGIIEKISSALPATLILWSVGLLIGSWMFCGTVPMIIYYGVQIISPRFLYVTAFLITAVLSTVTGTSWGSAGTIGVAIMGIAQGLNMNLAITAGAVVAGSYFGDKLSPFSDTTNLAPLAAGSELYDHIKHMLYTTVPAAIVSIIVYLIAGLSSKTSLASADSVNIIQSQLSGIYNWNIILLLPVIIMLAGSILKFPTLPTMVVNSLISVVIGIFIQGFSLKDGFASMINGFDIGMTGFNGKIIEDIATLINRGGAVSMTTTTILVFCSMGFAGIMSVSGMLDVVLDAILSRVKSTFGVVISTIVSCFTVAFVTGNSYLSILIPGELFKKVYLERNLHPKNLSRTLEDSGTVLVPLIPWSAAGAYMAATLGVETLTYLPWAVLNYTGIIFAIIWAITGIGITKISEEEKEKFLTKESEKL